MTSWNHLPFFLCMSFPSILLVQTTTHNTWHPGTICFSFSACHSQVYSSYTPQLITHDSLEPSAFLSLPVIPKYTFLVQITSQNTQYHGNICLYLSIQHSQIMYRLCACVRACVRVCLLINSKHTSSFKLFNRSFLESFPLYIISNSSLFILMLSECCNHAAVYCNVLCIVCRVFVNTIHGFQSCIAVPGHAYNSIYLLM